MKKTLSFVLVLSLCVIPFKNSASSVVKTEALNIPFKARYSDFSNKEQMQIDALSSISNNAPSSKAAYINKIQDTDLYEFCLKETLDIYYGDLETYASQLTAFKKSISSAADNIIKNYEVAAEERATGIENGYSPTEVLVSFEPGTTENTIKTIAENLGNGYEVLFDGFFEAIDEVPEVRKKYLNGDKDYGPIVSMNVDLDKTTTQTMQEITEIACVKSSSKNTLCERNVVASDFSSEPDLILQHYLDKINIGDAWQAIGDSRVFQETWVAVLDTGLDIDHEEVVGNYLNNYSVDVTKGENIEDFPKLKELTNTYSDNHGTAVWGIIRARPKNNKGITGMYLPVQDGYSGAIKVMAIKVYKDGTVTTPNAEMIKGISYAVEAGASVINISSYCASNATDLDSLHTMIKNAYSTNVTIVASAGNESSSDYQYPASFDEVIGVAATDNFNRMCSWTTNNDKTDICAPGSDIRTLNTDDRYMMSQGTSFSAPMVAGTVALMQSLYVHDTLAPDRVKRILKNTAVDLSDVNEWDNDLLNTGKAVEHARYIAMKDDTLTIRNLVVSNSNKAKVRWNQLQFSSCDGYKIYRSTSENGTYSAVADIKFEDALWDGNSACNYWYDNSSESGNTYYYKVRAYVKYGTGKQYSNYTAVKSITIP